MCVQEDFLWMHYESGPCKDRIDVPPAQVHTYRLTAILTMAGLGLLILVASPVIIVAAPCLLCYKFCPKDKNTDDSQQNEKTSLRSSENSSKTNGNAFSATGDSPCADSQCRKKSSVFACCPCGILWNLVRTFCSFRTAHFNSFELRTTSSSLRTPLCCWLEVFDCWFSASEEWVQCERVTTRDWLAVFLTIVSLVPVRLWTAGHCHSLQVYVQVIAALRAFHRLWQLLCKQP